MHLHDITRLVDNTLDAAFAVDMSGLIVAWNGEAEALFGVSAAEALEQPCGPIIQGTDESGRVCSEDCTVRQAAQKGKPLRNFDLQVQTAHGRQWCNISVLIAEDAGSRSSYMVHIVRPSEMEKRLEALMRDFIIAGTDLPPEKASALLGSTRAAARAADLTQRETQILGLLARGTTTADIANELHISRTTVSNHVQHILRKLDAHSRLEAIRRAEHAGLIKQS